MSPTLTISWPIALYFALSSISSATALAQAIKGRNLSHRWSTRLTFGFLSCLMMTGAVLLIFDLEIPRSAWLILSEGNPNSIISWGVCILAGFTLLVMGLAISPTDSEGRLTGFSRATLFTFAIALAVYPGLVLLQLGSPLWTDLTLQCLLVVSTIHFASLVGGLNRKLELPVGLLVVTGLVVLAMNAQDAYILPALAASALLGSIFLYRSSPARAVVLCGLSILVTRWWVIEYGVNL